MKKISRFLLFVLTIGTLVLSACAGTVVTPAATRGGGKVEPIPVAFIGLVESIAGDQWVINGQTVTIVPDVIRDGPFNVGDQVKVEGLVNADGSFAVSKVEAPTAQDSSALPQFGDGNSNDSNANDLNANDANSNDVNGNDVNANDTNSNDDNSNSLNANDANSNDDNGGNDNSDNSNNNDDNSNSGGGNDNGGGGNDDNGGGDNDSNGNGG
ncbi:MAG TPA: DUF5666 domain-containing protein [Anaerolineales bacterium]